MTEEDRLELSSLKATVGGLSTRVGELVKQVARDERTLLSEIKSTSTTVADMSAKIDIFNNFVVSFIEQQSEQNDRIDSLEGTRDKFMGGLKVILSIGVVASLGKLIHWFIVWGK